MTNDISQDVIQRALNKDESAIHEIFQFIEPRIRRFSIKMCGNPAWVEDTVQETLISVFKNLGAYRGDSRFLSWVFVIAKNHCFRQKQVFKFDNAAEDAHDESFKIDTLDTMEFPHVVSKSVSPLEKLEIKEFEKTLDFALQQLEPMYREVFLLRDLEGFSAEEVANILGISVAAVKSRLHRARKKVRDFFVGIDNAPSASAADSKTCYDIAVLFSMYLEGDLTGNLCERFQHHVAVCPGCKLQCDFLKDLLRMCQNIRTNSSGKALGDRDKILKSIALVR